MELKILFDLGTFVFIPVIRSVGGWANKALEDAKITKFEINKLISTVLRIGILQVMAYGGFSVLGVDNALLAAGCSAFVLDKFFSSTKKITVAGKK